MPICMIVCVRAITVSRELWFWGCGANVVARGVLLPRRMDLVTSLNQEHKLILDVMNAFEAFISRIGNGASVDGAELLRFVVFFSDFADDWHNAREEQLLFPAMARHGYSAKSRVFAHIREQHKHERELLIAWRHAAAEKAPWSNEQLQTFLRASREMLAFERAHIQKESELFFPEAAKELGEEPAAVIDAALAKFSETHLSEQRVHWLERLGHDLVASHACS
jgi:hemerythrin-like domain-containing protein